ncbi:MAG: hypothetical protein GY799_14075 [Desulfobulbaceae bacterium]|nr:hypothetical protein [Desulfobulbaceae bacterium]
MSNRFSEKLPLENEVPERVNENETPLEAFMAGVLHLLLESSFLSSCDL